MGKAGLFNCFGCGRDFERQLNVPAVPVKWKTLEYSSKDNGREILFKDIDPIEILILMKEMDESF